MFATPFPATDASGAAEKRMILAQFAGNVVFLNEASVSKKHPAPANVFVYVVDGVGQVELGDVTAAVKTGDLVEIPKGTLHGFKANAGELKLLIFAIPVRDAGVGTNG